MQVVADELPVLLSSVQLLSHVWLCDPMDCSMPGFPAITSSWSLLKLISIESMMPSNHLIFCRPLLLLPSIFPSIRIFSNKSVLCISWPKYWSFSFSISPSNEYLGLIYLNIGFDIQTWFEFPAIQKHQFFSTQVSLRSNSHIHTRLLEKP